MDSVWLIKNTTYITSDKRVIRTGFCWVKSSLVFTWYVFCDIGDRREDGTTKEATYVVAST